MSHAEKFDCTRVSNCFREPFTQQMEYKKPSEKSDCDRVEEWIASDLALFDSLNSFCHAEDDLGLAMSQHQIFEQQHFQEFGHMDDLYLDVLSPPFQSCGDEIQKIINGVESQDTNLVVPKKSRVSPSESFEVLRKYSRRHLMDDRGNEIQPTHVRGLALSTELVIKLAAEKFIPSMPESSNELSMLNHPYPTSILTLSEEDSKEVQLVQNLLSCAEKVAEKQYERALKFLKECGEMNSFTGTPIQRLAFYISEALSEKIAKETGRQKEPEKKPAKAIEPAKFVSSIPVYFKQFPVTQITNLVGSQTILHYLNKARKIHIVDLEIRSGVQWVQLMQDVAARREHPIQHLKITAVGTKSKSILEETGRQLASFAESVKLKFTFKIVAVEDILSLKLDLFDINAGESVAVYAAYTLMTMIGRADRLNHLMGVIRNLCPCVMVVTEMEANCNSQCYIERFVESLFLFGALFDSLADCLKDQESSRVDIESTLFRSSINNVLAAEGEERMMRHVRINVWRAIFAGFELLEIEPSLPSLDQANLLLQHFSYGSFITLCRNDKCLTLGWKGTELTSLSAWKMNTMFHAEKSDFARVSDDSAMSESSELVGSKDSSQKLDSYRVDGIGLFHAQDELEFAISPNQIYDQQCVKEFVDDLYSDAVSPPFQSCEDEAKTAELIEPKKRQHHVFPTESFEILRKYGSRRLKLDVKSSITSHEMQSDTTLSTETIIRVAAEKFIQSMSESSNELSMLNHPYPSYLLAHSGENSEGVQLIQNLLSCAEKVADNQYERALKFLKECDKKSFRLGTPIQRLVFYFSRALFEKIANETGRITPKDLEEKHGDPMESMCCPSMNMLISFHKEHPHSQVTKLVGVQAILDHLKEARKVHVIDLQIRSGVQWIILMQALAARTEHPIQHLKITAVGIKWKSIMDETGRQLTAFAQSLNLEFTFKIVLVENFLDLNHTLFDVVADESVAIYAPYVLATIVGRVDKLDHLMMVMKNMNPCVMIVTELEVNCNSPTFIGRFVESLFFFGAFFDSLGDCFKNDETSRLKAESTWFGSSISNILAADGDQRKFRHVNINVWRAFFARVGLVEIELSVSSLDQACLGLQSLPYGSSCTLYKDGKCLTLGWKGSPLSSLSAWKF